jgi:hypothetical protein
MRLKTAIRQYATSLEGSVATLELRRSLAIASAKLDRHCAEQAENEAVQQNSPPSQRTSARLAFADHMDRLVACDRAPSSPEGAKMLAGAHPALDRPMILFQNIVEILHRSVVTVFLQSWGFWEQWNEESG